MVIVIFGILVLIIVYKNFLLCLMILFFFCFILGKNFGVFMMNISGMLNVLLNWMNCVVLLDVLLLIVFDMCMGWLVIILMVCLFICV